MSANVTIILVLVFLTIVVIVLIESVRLKWHGSTILIIKATTISTWSVLERVSATDPLANANALKDTKERVVRELLVQMTVLDTADVNTLRISHMVPLGMIGLIPIAPIPKCKQGLNLSSLTTPKPLITIFGINPSPENVSAMLLMVILIVLRGFVHMAPMSWIQRMTRTTDWKDKNIRNKPFCCLHCLRIPLISMENHLH